MLVCISINYFRILGTIGKKMIVLKWSFLIWSTMLYFWMLMNTWQFYLSNWSWVDLRPFFIPCESTSCLTLSLCMYIDSITVIVSLLYWDFKIQVQIIFWLLGSHFWNVTQITWHFVHCNWRSWERCKLPARSSFHNFIISLKNMCRALPS